MTVRFHSDLFRVMLPWTMSVPANAPILTTAAMREAEAACAVQGTSLSELMEYAGAAVADTAWRMAAGALILILARSNGPVALEHAARLLAARGAAVRVAALAAAACPSRRRRGRAAMPLSG